MNNNVLKAVLNVLSVVLAVLWELDQLYVMMRLIGLFMMSVRLFARIVGQK